MTSDQQIIKDKMVSFRSQLALLPRTVALVWEAAARETVAWSLLLVLQGALPLLTLYLTKALVDGLVAVLKSGATWQNFQPLLTLVALTGGVMLTSIGANALASVVRTSLTELMRDSVMLKLQSKAITLDMAVFENAKFHDRLYRAQMAAKYRPLSQVESLGRLLQSFTTIIVLCVAIAPYGLWVPLALFISTVPAIYLLVHERLIEYKWRKKTTEDARRAWYLDWTLTGREAAAEVRIFDLGDHVQEAYESLQSRLRKERVGLAKRKSLVNLGVSFLGLIVTLSASGYMVWKAALGLITLGDLALFYQAFSKGQQVLRGFAGNAGELYSNTLFLADLFEFLDLEPEIKAAQEVAAVPPIKGAGLSFKNITFSYPGSDKPVLKDFSLQVPAGTFAAVVGPNGAGKSTMLKLACRFYDPQSGVVSLDDVDLKSLDPEKLRSSITVLFQEPFRYRESAKENIGVGDVSLLQDPKAIEQAAIAAGAHDFIEELPKKYDTPLGKWFTDATELSVGQWQRVALARAFLRKAPLILLDEPTSAMDAWAEKDWLLRFKELCAGRTALVITHRFTTAMHADTILVVEEGKVVESGSHEELLALGGRYAESLSKT